jgi:hypothetical protein
MVDVAPGGSGSKTVVSLEPIDAMIQRADHLLAEAQNLGQQYLTQSGDILHVGWDGQASQTSYAVAGQVEADLNQALAANMELHQHLADAKAQFLAQQADSAHHLASVHPGAAPSSQM